MSDTPHKGGQRGAGTPGRSRRKRRETRGGVEWEGGGAGGRTGVGGAAWLPSRFIIYRILIAGNRVQLETL